jgi:nitroimidazol reductase NimA-like FMN-containing flavoprotein (pyridoxamine 5'-phosphate oxidase superfamily)
LTNKSSSTQAPIPSRPYMPGYNMMFQKDKGFLSWTWAVDHFSRARNYFLSTTRSDGRPHVMPVWGVWLNRSFYFSTGRRSRKSKNLSLNSHCVVCPENASKVVILEGTAREIGKGPLRGRFVTAYKKKYDWDMSDTKEPIYEVRPQVIFGIAENSEANPTSWRFQSSR